MADKIIKQVSWLFFLNFHDRIIQVIEHAFDNLS